MQKNASSPKQVSPLFVHVLDQDGISPDPQKTATISAKLLNNASDIFSYRATKVYGDGESNN